MAVDTLSGAMIAIKNAEMVGKKVCEIRASKLIGNVLKVLKNHGYIKSFEFVKENVGGKFVVELTGNINDCGAIRPRFSSKVTEYEFYERRFLPARGFGILVVSTTRGIMSQKEAIELGLGGVLLAYVY
ncbi:MAG: 30S ribosomal protein S8 [Archaeoglobaceae archaeon]|nr:30S ribosomal protein S8 [Archaeoglobaceae archaeon]MDW8128460.1 30S ribosomal protein S8 [Archaeoglobaceae archaeon]